MCPDGEQGRSWTLEGTDDDMRPINVPHGPDLKPGERVRVFEHPDLDALVRTLDAEHERLRAALRELDEHPTDGEGALVSTSVALGYELYAAHQRATTTAGGCGCAFCDDYRKRRDGDKPVSPEIQAALETGYALGREDAARARSDVDANLIREAAEWVARSSPENANATNLAVRLYAALGEEPSQAVRARDRIRERLRGVREADG